MEYEPFMLAQVPSAPGARIHFSWGMGNEIFCCDITSDINRPSTSSCIEWGVLSAPQRRIAYDTASKYIELQKQLHEITSVNPTRSQREWAAVLAFSKAISTILECNSSASNDLEEVSRDDVQAGQERALWDLISLFSLDSRSTSLTSPVIPDLPKWLHSNAATLAGGPSSAPLPKSLSLALQESALPESHAHYWPTLHRITALGWTSEALELLGLHSAWLQWGTENPDIDAQVAVLEAATLLLRRTPKLKGRGATPEGNSGSNRLFDSLQECLTYRTAWREQCLTLLEDDSLWDSCSSVAPETALGVKSVISILAGHEDALIAATKTWSELLVAKLINVHPDVQNLAQLRHILHDCLEQRGLQSEFNHVVATVLDACCQSDAQTALRACSAIASDWFMAHIPVILASHPAGSSLIDRDLDHLGTSQKEFYTLEFATALTGHSSTWALASSYLAWCPIYGRGGFEALMERLPLDSSTGNTTSLKAVDICKEHGMLHVASLIQTIQGTLCWQDGLVGAALTWLNQAQDTERVDEVLRPLASQVWDTNSDSHESIEYMKEILDSTLPGSAYHAMLQVKRLLVKENISEAVHLLHQLPSSHLRQCLGEVLAVLPTADPASLSSESIVQLLQWLEAHSDVQSTIQQAVSRVAIIRLLVAAHAREN